jgi:hypothetical protein
MDGVEVMRTARTLIPIPVHVAAEIDRIAGHRQRTAFVVELLEREIRRREQLKAIEEAAGCWKDELHPELAAGSEAWVRQMRQESEARLQRLEQQRDAD